MRNKKRRCHKDIMNSYGENPKFQFLDSSSFTNSKPNSATHVNSLNDFPFQEERSIKKLTVNF